MFSSVKLESQPEVERFDQPLPAPSGPLAHIPLFAALSATEQHTMLSSMREEKIDANQNIVWHGDSGDSFYVINEGKVAVCISGESGTQLVLNYLSRGGFFGEISLFDGGPRTATVRAVEPTSLYVLGRQDFHAFIKRHPEAAIDIITTMGRRFRGVSEILRTTKNPNEVYQDTHYGVWERVCDYVTNLAASQAFTVFHIAWFVLWVIINELGSFGVISTKFAFDPYPFGLLTVICSLEAIFLAIFVMVSQNRQAQKERLRNDLEFQVNVKAQTEIMSIARRLENMEELLIKEKNKLTESE